MIQRLAFLVAALIAASRLPGSVLVVDPASVRIEVAVHATVDSFTARIDPLDIALNTDPTGALTSATVDFKWLNLKTGNLGRDRVMLAWAHADQIPGGRFTLAQLLPGAEPTAFTATGTLLLNGESHDFSFPVKIAQSTSGWSVSGEAILDHRIWGLPKIRKFAIFTVDPLLVVRFAFNAHSDG